MPANAGIAVSVLGIWNESEHILWFMLILLSLGILKFLTKSCKVTMSETKIL